MGAAHAMIQQQWPHLAAGRAGAAVPELVQQRVGGGEQLGDGRGPRPAAERSACGRTRRGRPRSRSSGHRPAQLPLLGHFCRSCASGSLPAISGRCQHLAQFPSTSSSDRVPAPPGPASRGPGPAGTRGQGALGVRSAARPRAIARPRTRGWPGAAFRVEVRRPRAGLGERGHGLQSRQPAPRPAGPQPLPVVGERVPGVRQPGSPAPPRAARQRRPTAEQEVQQRLRDVATSRSAQAPQRGCRSGTPRSGSPAEVEGPLASPIAGYGPPGRP